MTLLWQLHIFVQNLAKIIAVGNESHIKTKQTTAKKEKICCMYVKQNLKMLQKNILMKVSVDNV